MFQDIKQYITKTREERQNHLDLTEPCIVLGGGSGECRALLAHYLKTTIPIHQKIHLCHACHNHYCSNPKHIYWGTYLDNARDAKLNPKYVSFPDRIKNKMSEEKYNKYVKRSSSNGGKCSKSTVYRTINEILEIRKMFLDNDCSKFGWIQKLVKKYNISHTQIRKLYKKYCLDITVYTRNSPVSSKPLTE